MDFQEAIKKIFYNDGSLRDIYILDANTHIWTSIFNYFERMGVNYEITEDGSLTEVRDIYELIKIKNESNLGITIDVKGIEVHGYFNLEDVIEFDISPKDINSVEKLYILMDLLKGLSKELNKSIIITPEMTMEEILIRVEPNREIKFFM